jgi:hypothetical protein
MQRTMNGQGQSGQNQSGQNQINWQQFSLRERARGEYLETCREHEKDHENDAEDAKFDVAVSTPTSRRRTGRTGQPAEKHMPRKVQVQVQETPTPTTDDVPHELVQKAKTRAARRADDETPETPDVKLPTKRTRRSDYRVQRDDERRSAARTLKAGFQNCQTETE